MAVSEKNAFETGIPANAAIIGTGEYTKGLVLQICNRHSAGHASLQGHFRVVHGDVSAAVCGHLPLPASLKMDIVQALTNSKKKSFENVRESILKLIGVEHNAEQLNQFLFHPSQWSIVSNE
jgi:hypothetical protein